MVRSNKKAKRKRAHKKWRKKKNILKNWKKEERNRRKAGLPRRSPPVQFGKKVKEINKIMKEAKARADKYKESQQKND